MSLNIHTIGKHSHVKLSIMEDVVEMAIALKQNLNASPIVSLNKMKVNYTKQP
jgi:hypothetical protein